jgi:penicillin-binding protein 1C
VTRALAALALLFVATISGLEARYGGVAVPSFAAVRAAHPSSEATLVDRRGEVVQEVRIDRQVRRLAWTPLGAISPALIDAVIASEDRRFFAHGGVDLRALAAACGSFVRGDRRRGASTITMQLARLIAGAGAPRAPRRTLAAKLWQVRAARALESSWSKREILEAYLNLVDFRGELQGVAAASGVLYGKAPHGLDGAEAVALAALIRSPNAEPAKVTRRARSLALDVTSPVSGSEIAAAVATALEAPLRRAPQIALAAHLASRLRPRLAPGQTVVTTLDAGVQRLAGAALRRQILAVRDRNANDGAVLVVDNPSGEVLAYVGSSGELSSARHVDGVRAPRQSGSALKPFLYGLSFDRRLLTPASLLEDAPLEVAQKNGVYRPENYDREFRGLVSVRTALAGSLNVPAVRALLTVGLDAFATELRTLGFSRVAESGEYYGPALALGSVEVSLWELVAAYRALANGGVWSPLAVLPGEPRSLAGGRRVYSEPAAFLVSSILSDRDSRSTTFGLENPLATPFWSAVKTGTSKDMRDNWCVGYSRRYTVGVWVGNFAGDPMRDVTGISGAAPAWLEVLSALEARAAGGAPAPPAGVVEREATFPRGVETARREWFLSGTEPRDGFTPPLAARARIVSPAAGSIIARDPDIPASRQRVVFEAEAPSGGLVWRLDGRSLGPADRPILWVPRPGRHELALVGRNLRTADRVSFVVRPAR